MHFFILGGTGFIGNHLAHYLAGQGHRLSLLVRSQAKSAGLPKSGHFISGDPTSPGSWQKEAAQADVLVNLVGKSIMTRWTEQEKEAILNTRVQATAMAVQALGLAAAAPPCLINANAVGYYPSDGAVYDESGPADDTFLARVCSAWQDEASKATELGARTVILRIAPVLGSDGGMLQSILPIFRLGLGGRIGSGKQGFPWIHVRDLVRAVEFLARHQDIHGPVNACAPKVIDNAGFTQALGRALRRPTVLPVPAIALKAAFGEMAQMLLQAPKVEPRALLDAAFQFDFPRIEQALEDVLASRAAAASAE